MKIINRIILFFVVSGIFSSCMKNEICSPANLKLEAGIYTLLETDGIIDTIQTKMDIDSVYGLTREDNNLLLNATEINEISFPLNDAANETGYVLSIGGINDTLSFIYEKHLLFYSVKCGFSYTYTITSINYSTNFLQEIVLINSEIDVVSAENIQLVF